MSKRILLGQLASNGDCLYATTIARQIKVDFPGCHLTWAIGSNYRSIIEGNPDVDEVWEVSYYDSPGDIDQWQRFEVEAKERQARGEFDEIFLSQVHPDIFHLWFGSVRSTLFRAYPLPISVHVAPVLRLSASEIERVRLFVENHHLAAKAAVILFECAPRSLQSFVTPEFALNLASHMSAKHSEVALILSSNHSFVSPGANIIDGSVLSLRENAELTKYCSLLIGASSGVTWIATSDWAKPLPMLQLIRPDVVRSNSLVYDFEKRGADTSKIIEMSSYAFEDVASCLDEILTGHFAVARAKFHQKTPLEFEHFRILQQWLQSQRRWKQAFQLLNSNLKEYGFHREFVAISLFYLLLSFKGDAREGLRRLKSRLKR